MTIHHVNAISAATTAVDARAIASIWNPHASRRIYVLEVWAFATTAPAAGAGFEIRRSSTRGTATATVTPDLDNSLDRDSVAPSGFLLDHTFSAEPTLDASSLGAFMFAAVAASGVVMPLRRTCVPPGTGLVLVNRAAVICPASEITFVVED